MPDNFALILFLSVFTLLVYYVTHLWIWGTTIPTAMLSSYILICLNHKSEKEKNDGIKH